MRERECSLAVAEGRTNLSELARLNSENEARLERGKTTAKSLPDPHPFPRLCGVRSSRFSSCERPIHQSLRAVGVHLLNSMPTMNYRKPSVPDNGGCKCLQLDCNGCLTAPLRHLMNQSCLRSDILFRAVKAYAALACSSSHCFSTAFDMPAFLKLNVSPYLRRAVAMRTSLAAT